MDKSRPLVMEDLNLREGKPGTKPHHMGGIAQHRAMLLDHVDILATVCGVTDKFGPRHQ